MNPPDPRVDLIGAFDYLVKRVDESLSLQMETMRLLALKSYGIEDIARLMQVGEDTVCRQPWNQPNWGRSDVPGHKKLWFPTSFWPWFFNRSEDERRAEWEAMTPRQKRAAKGIAA